MIFLYILLIIIAIGVLLASEAGQRFLGGIISLGFWGVILFLGIGIIGLVIAFLSSETGQELLVGFACLTGIIFVLYLLSKQIDKHPELQKWCDDACRKNKWSFSFAVTSIIAMLAVIIWVFFK